MKYIVLDLDHTIADLHSYLFPLIALQLSLPQIDRAYFAFVNHILRQERSPCPIGLLRPGILTVMEQYSARVRNHEFHPLIIYSNNSYLPCLHFIRDIIHAHVGMRLIEQTIHWNHPIRAIHDKRDPSFTKTWLTLRAVLGPIDATDVLLFDDQSHPHIEAVLGARYYHVAPYHFYSSFERVQRAFLDALDEAAVSRTDMEEALAQGGDSPTKTLEEHLQEYAVQLGETAGINECPIGKCEAFWRAMQAEEYDPMMFLR
jgi:hypothetical protein